MDFIKSLVEALEKRKIKKLSIEVNGIIYDNNFSITNNTLMAYCSSIPTESLVIKLDDLVGYVADKKIDIKINF